MLSIEVWLLDQDFILKEYGMHQQHTNLSNNLNLILPIGNVSSCISHSLIYRKFGTQLLINRDSIWVIKKKKVFIDMSLKLYKL